MHKPIVYVCMCVRAYVCRCCSTVWRTWCTAMSRWRRGIPDLNRTSFYHHLPPTSTHLPHNRWQTHSKPTI